MRNRRIAGFTLIELLTVIAIIGILAAIVTVAVPRAIEKAKLADVNNDFLQLRNALTTYASDNNRGYPPGYGYRRMTDQEIIAAGGDPYVVPYDTSIEDFRLFYLGNYMQYIGHFKDFDLYDRFNPNTHDTNGDRFIRELEYLPVGTPDPVNQLTYTDFSGQLYIFGTNNGTEVARMVKGQGPYIYIPVYSLYAKRYAQYCLAGYTATNDLGYANAQYFDPTDTTPVGSDTIGHRYLERMTFPPPKYDAFVLISVGPNENVSGVLPDPLPGQEPENILEAYDILGLRAYFLATRDINNNGKLDFDFIARTREKEDANAFADGRLGYMPDGSGAAGPLIFKQGG